LVQHDALAQSTRFNASN